MEEGEEPHAAWSHEIWTTAFLQNGASSRTWIPTQTHTQREDGDMGRRRKEGRTPADVSLHPPPGGTTTEMHGMLLPSYATHQ